MKTYGGVDAEIHFFLISALVGGEWSASGPGEIAPGTHWIGGWVGPRTGLYDVEKRKFLTLPGLDHPGRSQSLYRLWHVVTSVSHWNSFIAYTALCQQVRDIQLACPSRDGKKRVGNFDISAVALLFTWRGYLLQLTASPEGKFSALRFFSWTYTASLRFSQRCSWEFWDITLCSPLRLWTDYMALYPQETELFNKQNIKIPGSSFQATVLNYLNI
jgi:hypothetical protein